VELHAIRVDDFPARVERFRVRFRQHAWGRCFGAFFPRNFIAFCILNYKENKLRKIDSWGQFWYIFFHRKLFFRRILLSCDPLQIRGKIYYEKSTLGADFWYAFMMHNLHCRLSRKINSRGKTLATKNRPLFLPCNKFQPI
jgi:hypothetical protein